MLALRSDGGGATALERRHDQMCAVSNPMDWLGVIGDG